MKNDICPEFNVNLVTVPGLRDDEIMLVPSDCAREITRLAMDRIFGRLNDDDVERAIANLVRYAVPRSAVMRIKEEK